MNFCARKSSFSAFSLTLAVLSGCGDGGSNVTAVSDAGATQPSTPPLAAPAPAAPAPIPAAAPAPAAAAPAPSQTTPVISPAPNPPPSDLTEPASALRLAAALIEATPASTESRVGRFTGNSYRTRSSISISGCRVITFTNADGAPSAGDRIDDRRTNCSLGGANSTFIDSRTSALNLTSLSNPLLPQSAAWTASESMTVTGSSNWDYLATSNNYVFKGQGSYTQDSTLQISQSADGTQQGLFAWRITARGSDSGGAYDFVVESTFTCSYASGQIAGQCSGTTATLQGTLNGAPANATLTQPSGSAPSFEITQGNQKISVFKNLSTGEFLVTTASGQPFVTVVLDSINGY